MDHAKVRAKRVEIPVIHGPLALRMGPDDFNEALWHLSGGRLIFAEKLGIY